MPAPSPPSRNNSMLYLPSMHKRIAVNIAATDETLVETV
jgi:hypothetical protein